MASSFCNSVFETVSAESAEMRARLVSLDKALRSQAEEQAAADERLRALSNARVHALTAFMRQHAEEEQQRRALEEYQQGIAAAWERIRQLHADEAEVTAQKAAHATASRRSAFHQDSRAMRILETIGPRDCL